MCSARSIKKVYSSTFLAITFCHSCGMWSERSSSLFIHDLKLYDSVVYTLGNSVLLTDWGQLKSMSASHNE